MAATVDHSRADLAEKVSWHYCALLLAIMMLVLNCYEESDQLTVDARVQAQRQQQEMKMMKACDEIYVVGEGETLQTISEKCGDPFIVEDNPHIHDPDDVFPGLLIKITPFNHR